MARQAGPRCGGGQDVVGGFSEMRREKTALSYWFPKIEAAGIPVPRTTIVHMPKEAQEAIWAAFDGKEGGDPKPFFAELTAAARAHQVSRTLITPRPRINHCLKPHLVRSTFDSCRADAIEGSQRLRATSGPIKSRCHRNIAATSVMMQASPSRIWTPTTARKTGEVEGIANPLCWSSTAAPPPQARPRPTSRISNTGQSGAALPEHRATVLANRRSSFFRSLSLALMSSR